MKKSARSVSSLQKREENSPKELLIVRKKSPKALAITAEKETMIICIYRYNDEKWRRNEFHHIYFR